ncbi:hypothetical protein [Flavobacterium hydrophilum]|uniref:Uncharacterized protein n=1 Tax=Flavobacterium hydrophilum TaxID=2211445 RepID=A0A2V4C0C1_9FLAO|nr:hypothetical protein [Flavobacterium hydrophilum]PXY44437.1 hypothetical protein DMB68_13290 [Flavobacterium hydrophilum]
MNLKHIFILLILASCQKEQKKNLVVNVNSAETTELPAVTDKTKAEENTLRTDTIFLSNEKNAEFTHILANLTELKADKDSILTSKFRLDFYQNKTKITSSRITITNYEKGAEWGGSSGLSNASGKNSSFIQIGFGYPACGYTHENYLFYLKKHDLQLVHQWQSMSDSGWGSWTEFVSNASENDPESFYCKTVSFEPGDDSNEDSGIVTYSDSISFSLKGTQWKKKLLSVKDKPYFEKKMSFNEFHNQQ